MIRSRTRVTVCSVLIILNVAFIWINSLLPREISAAFSKFVGQILDFFIPSQGSVAEGQGNGILRKIAHFTEFCSLGVLLSWLVRMVRSKKWEWIWIPLAAGAAVACIDELIQTMIPGRGPGILDVCIDVAGVTLGILLIVLIKPMKKRSQKKKLK